MPFSRLDTHAVQSIFSAPFPGHGKTDPAKDVDAFHEWDLDRPSDILQVFLLMKNIDAWTAGGFVEKVEKGIKQLVKQVENGGQYRPWKKHDGVLIQRSSSRQKENANIRMSSTASSVAGVGNVVVNGFVTPTKGSPVRAKVRRTRGQ